MLLTFSGFWFGYQSSQRAELKSPNQIQIWLRSNRRRSRQVSLLVFATGSIISVITLGFWAGLFGFLMILSVLGSLVILLSPFGLVNSRNIAVLFLLSFICELFF